MTHRVIQGYFMTRHANGQISTGATKAHGAQATFREFTTFAAGVPIGSLKAATMACRSIRHASAKWAAAGDHCPMRCAARWRRLSAVIFPGCGYTSGPKPNGLAHLPSLSAQTSISPLAVTNQRAYMVSNCLGHELAHVVQQRQGRVRAPNGTGIAVVQDHALEAEADRLGQRAAATVQAKPSGTVLQRQPPMHFSGYVGIVGGFR